LSEYISERLHQAVRNRANRRCEYCLCTLDVSTEPFEIDHIIPTARGGPSTLDNLALACSGCNSAKSAQVDGFDPVGEQTAPLYNPRRDAWRRHFSWEENSFELIGLTPTGRVTITTLGLNRPGVLNLRLALYLLGLHPPEEMEGEE
jgi:hypothetical protein